MGYREIIMSQNPLSYWPLDDNASLGIAAEATGYGTDATYSGAIFDKAIPLVANGIYGTRLTDSTAVIEYTLPGSPGIWTKGREQKAFSLEIYFKLETNDTTLSEDILILGNISTGNKYGIYLSGNKIYFKPDANTDYFVSYDVSDWKRRYHVIANYSSTQISLTVNGKNISSKYAPNDFAFSQTSDKIKTAGSNAYDITIDSVAIYGYNIDKSRAVDHSDLSRKSMNKGNYFTANSQVYYMPNNKECVLAYSFLNNWQEFKFTNAVFTDKGEITLRYLDDQKVSSGSPSFSTVGSRNSISLSGTQYLDVSNVVELADSGVAIGVSFYKQSGQYALISLENSTSAQSLYAYINTAGFVVLGINGEETITTASTITGWNELLINLKSGSINVYLNGSSIHSQVAYLSSITLAYIGRVNDMYSSTNFSWVAIKSNTQSESTPTTALYASESDFILKLDGSLKWSQYGYAEGFIYVPNYDYDGSLAFYTASSDDVEVTYNSGQPWPKFASMPGLLDNPAGQVNSYTINIKLSTNDSVNDMPVLRNLGLYVYGEDMKRVISENSHESAVIHNKDNAVIFDDDVEILDRLEQAGIRLAGNSYLTIPSQSKNQDTGGFNGTKSITIVFKINEALSGTKYIIQSGSKALYWDGSSWQFPGFNKMYVNGIEAFDNQAMVGDWVHVVLTSTSKINAGTDIYVGSDSAGANQTDLTLGAFAMAAYVLDQYDVNTEYESFTGYPQESLVTDNIGLEIIDYGLIPYRYALQRA